MRRLIVRPEAAAELSEAVDWYEARQPGLGQDLVVEIHQCLEDILRFPESYPIMHRTARMAVVKRFPYLVIYQVEPDRIQVLAIFHAKRDPRSWQTR